MKVKNLNLSNLDSVDDANKNEAVSAMTPGTMTTNGTPQNAASLSNPASTAKLKFKFAPLVFFNNLSRRNKIIIISSTVAVTSVIGVLAFFYFYVFPPPSPQSQLISTNTKFLSPNIASSNKQDVFKLLTTLKKPQEPRTEPSPTNGVLYTESEMQAMKQNLPVAVMYNNHSVARPQSNLSKADVVFETMAEGGITRYMAIFWSFGAKKVGSIRSARQYYVEWLNPYDALYIHDGYASSNDPRTDAGGNIFRYGIKDIATRGAWREFDGRRYAPHNEYNSVVSAWEYAKTRGWVGFRSDFQPWQFKRDAKPEDRGQKTKVRVRFWRDLHNGGAYDAMFQYDPGSNSYLRFIGGQPDMDQEYNTQVRPKVVVLQSVQMQPANDGFGRVIITTIGSGDAQILMDGKIYPVKWEKKSRTDQTRFFTPDGQEFPLNRGQVWICAVPFSQGQVEILEQ